MSKRTILERLEQIRSTKHEAQIHFGFRHSAGFSLLETTLFLGIFSIIAGTIVAVFLSTQNARVQQLSVARVEQEGTQIVAALGKTIRRAERIVPP